MKQLHCLNRSAVAALACSVLSYSSHAVLIDVTDGATDTVGAELLPGDFLGIYTNYPGPESPAQAIDNDINTKYLTFQGAGLNDQGELTFAPSGMIVVLPTPSSISAVQFTTANDFASRDPAEISIYGTNLTGTAAELADGGDVLLDWTPVYAGPTGIPAFADVNSGRFTDGEVQAFAPSEVYSTYLVIITDLVRYEGNAPTNAQFAEIKLLTDVDIALPGDADGDGDVDNSDLQAAIANFTGPQTTPASYSKTIAEGDNNGDGAVSNTDLQAAISNFTGPIGGAPVPEPASLALLGLAGPGLARRRRA